MFLLDPILSHFTTLQWSQATPKVRPLPPHIKREYVQTPDGELELLVCEPQSTSATVKPATTKAPIFFAHGGCGHASVWLEWMTYLYQNSYPAPLYAFSSRNHGASYTLPYSKMVNNTTFEDLQTDAIYCLNHIEQRHKETTSSSPNVRAPIFVGHSSGGGLLQAIMTGTFKSTDTNPNISLKHNASALCVVSAIPHYGSYDMYWNWFKQDPWFPLRSLFHLGHPNSPLSTDSLVHGAFFGHLYPLNRAAEFRAWMPEYESMGWPSAMVGNSFGDWWGGKPNLWLDPVEVVRALDGVGTDQKSDKICVMVGKEDMMYRSEMWERVCDEFRDALKKAGRRRDSSASTDNKAEEPIKAVSTESEGGVRLVLVADSGHHVQNDVYCDEAVEALLRWANQI